MKILIVEDEPELADALRQSLETEKFLVEHAGNFHQALNKIISFFYDCILLDIGLPGGSGLDLLRELKQMERSGNVIIISARDSLDDKLTGLDLGADDYLVKPFHLAELHARIRSVLRRNAPGGRTLLEAGNVALDPDERTATVAEKELVLNRKEFDVLSYFMVNKNRVVDKTSLAEYVWGDYMDDADDYEFIYSQIKNLRKKLKDSLADIEIQAVYGMGYKLVLP